LRGGHEDDAQHSRLLGDGSLLDTASASGQGNDQEQSE